MQSEVEIWAPICRHLSIVHRFRPLMIATNKSTVITNPDARNYHHIRLALVHSCPSMRPTYIHRAVDKSRMLYEYSYSVLPTDRIGDRSTHDNRYPNICN